VALMERSVEPPTAAGWRQGQVSRRRLLSTALAATAGVLPGWVLSGRPASAAGSSAAGSSAAPASAADAYQQAVLAALERDRDVRRFLEPGREFLYRPRQLLVDPADLERVIGWLRARKYVFTVDDGFGGTARLRFTDEVDVPAIVTGLREAAQWKDRVAPRVQPHHVTIGFGNIMGNPDGAPTPVAGLAAPDPALLADGVGVTVGICDTGIWAAAGTVHPVWLGGGYLPEADDEDSLYVTGHQLAVEGGHGTFVAGVLRQAAPGVRFDPEPALSPVGIGDEEMLCAAIGRLADDTSVINCSLGCYTQDDVAPLPLGYTMAALPATTVVVAAAGNAGGSRPTWPAALPTVAAVAAVDRIGEDLVPAGYSNFGPWVDACAGGDRTSTYVEGELVLPGTAPVPFKGFARWAGTSFAAPHVCGRLATVMSRKEITADKALALLIGAAPPLAGYGTPVA
jgi:hypothetical protein